MLDYRYIIALITGSLFFLALVVYVCSALRNRHLDKLRKIKQYEIYSDPNLVKMDYDMAYYDEETQAKLLSRAQGETQVSIDDLLNSRSYVTDSSLTPFAKIEDEEIEEITGTYVPN